MYGSSKNAPEEQYERKLALVKAVREENRMNLERIGRRHHLFYGGEQRMPANGRYGKDRGYGEAYTQDAMYDAGEGDEGTQRQEVVSAAQFFAVRILFAAAGVALFWGIKHHRLDVPVQLADADVKEYLAEDFSKQVVDYIKDFTYTWGYEKTSIE
ncbi:MAG: hypothetical protein IJ711_01715 [Lachnospiraceae bacterium]|nr:hypothetical protein [Lachnospiraceae bacterium]